MYLVKEGQGRWQIINKKKRSIWNIQIFRGGFFFPFFAESMKKRSIWNILIFLGGGGDSFFFLSGVNVEEKKEVFAISYFSWGGGEGGLFFSFFPKKSLQYSNFPGRIFLFFPFRSQFRRGGKKKRRRRSICNILIFLEGEAEFLFSFLSGVNEEEIFAIV